MPRRVLDAKAGRRSRPAAAALHRGDAAHGDGDGGRTLDEKELSRRDAGVRPRHAGDARGDHRDAAAARVHRARRQDAPGDRQGRRARRDGAPAREEPGDDRRVGGEARAHRARRGEARRVHAGDRALRARGGRQRRVRPPTSSRTPASASTRDIGAPTRATRAARPLARPGPRARPISTSSSATSFGFPSFRPYQEEVCRAAAEGADVLLVMPTGAGKSLCYQLPGIARGGTTLVVSPLIALMEDQVAQLVEARLRRRAHPLRARSRRLARGVPAPTSTARSTSSSSRPSASGCRASRRCSRAASRRSSPSTRRTASRSGATTSGPTTACSASASRSAARAGHRAHGDGDADGAGRHRRAAPARRRRRASSTASGARTSASRSSSATPASAPRSCVASSRDPARRPAIVYAPTRKEAEQLADDALASASAPPRTTRAWPRACATRADGVPRGQARRHRRDDRVRHGHRQGRRPHRHPHRAARDASRATTRRSAARAATASRRARCSCTRSSTRRPTSSSSSATTRSRTSSRSIEKAHPARRDRSTSSPARAKVAARSVFEKALEKLWIHGGAIVDADDTVRRGDGRLAARVRARSARTSASSSTRCAATRRRPACRMLQLVAHFGDQNDAARPAGCATSARRARASRRRSARRARPEHDAARRILAALRERDGRAVGQLHRDCSRTARSIGARSSTCSARSRAPASVTIVADEFVKDGETIAFQRVHLARRTRGLSTPSLRMVVVPEPSEGKRPLAARRRVHQANEERRRGGALRAARRPRSAPA